MTGYFHRVAEVSPTRLWINNVTPDEAVLAIEAGATGCTQNPSYPYKMLTHPTGGAHALELLDAILPGEPDDNAAQAKLQLALVREVAEVFLPMHERTHGRAGYVTIQANPYETDADAMERSARIHCAALPNIMAKIPAVPDGFAAIERLLPDGLPLLATEVMSVSQALRCADVYRTASENMKNPPVMYFAHIPGIFDEYMAGAAKRDGADVPADLLYRGGTLVAQKIWALLRDRGAKIGFCSGGARGLHHFTELVGAPFDITINWGGAAEELIRQDPPAVPRFPAPATEAAADVLCAKLPEFRMAYEAGGLAPEDYEAYGPVRLFMSNFEDAWTKALAIIKDRRREKGL